MQEVSREQVQRLITRSKVCVIEVLPEPNFRQAHLPGAINVPLDHAFTSGVQRAVPDQNAVVIVYCSDRTSELSPRAAAQLDRLGYTKVFDYRAGKADWQSAGLPLERG